MINATALDLAASTIGGTLSATATTGGITDSGNVSVVGNVTLNDVAQAGITLDTLQADANVILTSAGNTALINDATLNLEGTVTGTLAATATTGRYHGLQHLNSECQYNDGNNVCSQRNN